MNSIDITILLVSLGVLLFLSAFFSGSETSLFSLSPAQRERFAEGSDRRSRAITRLLEDPESLLITILFGNLLVNTTSTVIATNVLLDVLDSRGLEMAIISMTILILVFGEITPKTFAVNNPERFALRYAPTLLAFQRATRPIHGPLKRLTTRWVRRMARRVQRIEGDITKKELARLLDTLSKDCEDETIPESDCLPVAVDGEVRDLSTETVSEEALDKRDVEMIRGVFRFTGTRIGDIMIPRSEIVALPSDIDVSGFLEEAKVRGKNRIPLYSDTLDDVIGIVHAADLLTGDPEPDVDLLSLTRRPIFVTPETKANDLLVTFRSTGNHLALVRDQNDDTTLGLVSLEDLLEVLVGEIRDDFETGLEELVIDGVSKVVSPRMSMKEFNLLFKTDFPGKGTVGSMVKSAFKGRVKGKFTMRGIRFAVIGWDQGAPTRFLITRKPVGKGRQTGRKDRAGGPT